MPSGPPGSCLRSTSSTSGPMGCIRGCGCRMPTVRAIRCVCSRSWVFARMAPRSWSRSPTAIASRPSRGPSCCATSGPAGCERRCWRWVTARWAVERARAGVARNGPSALLGARLRPGAVRAAQAAASPREAAAARHLLRHPRTEALAVAKVFADELAGHPKAVAKVSTTSSRCWPSTTSRPSTGSTCSPTRSSRPSQRFGSEHG